jgi:uncharacterized protein YdhG (YjbR/CyaY superfamily)
MKQSSKNQTVESYIDDFEDPVAKRLKALRAAVKKAAPKADESISYGMIGYKLNGKPLVYFGGFKKHIGLYPTPAGIATFAKELAPYKHAKGSVQFPHDEKLPITLITKIVKMKVSELTVKTKKITCSRGHVFLKSKDQPTCPKCWPGRYRKTVVA